jgi:hypothetical protein
MIEVAPRFSGLDFRTVAGDPSDQSIKPYPDE